MNNFIMGLVMACDKKWYFEFIKDFSKNTSIHGIRFLGLNISYIERIFWLITLTIAIFYSYILMAYNKNHFMANPTVVTIKKDFRNWENPFPAVTACFIDKMDPVKAEAFILRKWGITRNDTKHEYYMDFIKTISNLTYTNLDELVKFRNDYTLNKVEMVELVTEVHPTLNGVLVTFSKEKTDWQFILTEQGLCFTLNSGFADLLSPSYLRSSNLVLGSYKENLKCHYLNGLCYARYDSDPNKPIQYHIHSSLETIHLTSEPPLLVGMSEEVEVDYRLTETYSSPDIRYLYPEQRKCRFDDEPHTKNVPAYSISICYMECRYKLAMGACGCKPFFYKFLEGKVCDVEGLLCVHGKLPQIYNVTQCRCPQPCNLRIYLKQTPRVTRWETGYFDQRITFRWGLMPPTTKYHRRVLFGFLELIVSLGGICSLLFGMSFISAQELIYLCWEYFYLRR